MRSILRGFILGAGLGLLLFATTPLQAQTAVPNTTTAVQSIAETAQSLGALGFAVVCLGIALVILIVGVLLFFWKAISPLLTAITASTKSRDEAAAAEREAREEAQSASSAHLKLTEERERDTQALRTRQAEAMESQAKTMERIMEKMKQDDERSVTERTEAVTAINAHTDEVVAGAKEQLEQAATHVEAAARTIGDVVTKDHLTQELTPIREELHESAVTLRKKGDTDKLDPAKVPPTDPAPGSRVIVESARLVPPDETDKPR